jgi:hypothetical protein
VWTVSPTIAAGECTPASLRKALSEDRPKALLHVAEIPAPVLDAFWRAYGPSDPTQRMADPGEKFQATDFIVDDLPWRRLIAAAASPHVAWILYERGGRGLGRFLFVACLTNGTPTGTYSALRAPAGYDDASLAPALRGGCLVSPPREHWLPNDEERCPPDDMTKKEGP